ncbi:secretion protein HlyD [Rhodospirillum rubrum]|uniref:secretion protein HlyD n=1 Tax=Rhodospirillum rubrum TaxID=1085 RepID=UPI001904DEC2|nr:secretion protein HlyD [Rhodospirillum rubrum]MBK1663593.1 secretion protein HlyD [Rhodospirillum rubrum]MBK1677398.1 secretion protein HlyD [Rhodospirillum rubrum]
MKKRLLGGVLGLVILGGGLAVWGDIPTRLGWGGEGEDRLTLYGNVDIRQVQLGFRVSGRIDRAMVDEGDFVTEGTVLARLDVAPYDDAVRAAEAGVGERQASLDKRVAGPRPAEIAQAKAVYAEHLANLTYARQDFDKANKLLPSGAVSRSLFDHAQAQKGVALARVDAAREALRLLEEGTRAEDIAAARASLLVAQADLSSARTARRDTAIKAPADGVILSRVREPGAIVASGDIVYVMSLKAPVWVRAYVSESNLGRVYPGLPVEVLTDSAPHKPYRGIVGFVSPVAEFTPKTVETPDLRTDLVYRLRVVIAQADDGLRQGMPVTLRLAPPGGPQALPSSSPSPR